jgi:transglutaminase-like putative cysteine protease
MTATLQPPAEATPPPAHSPTAPTAPAVAGTPWWQRTHLVATLALTAVSAATAVGMIRLFADWSYLRPMLLVVIGVHAVCFGLRWARVPGWFAVPIGILAAGSAVGIAYHPGTVVLGLPTPSLLDALRLDLRLVFDQFPTAVAPVPSVGVFAASAALLLALCAAVSDTFAFRAFGRLEAVVPAGLVFIFTSALGADRHRVAVTVVWLAAALVCVACLRAGHDHDDVAWLGRPRRDVAGATLTAVVLGSLIALVAGAVGPRLPGAGDDPLIETRNRISDVTQVVSPLVDIRSRLVNRSNVTMVTVEASFASYWRSVTLSEFDGRTWKPADQDLQPTSSMPGTPPAGAALNYQRITVGGAGGPFLPVAGDPIAASGDLQWAASSGSLVVPDDGLQRGDVYEVASAVPSPSPDLLRDAGIAGAPGGSTALPDGVPDEALTLAREVTSGAATPYDQALALQNWFQDNFDYDLDVQLGHSDDAIREFLSIRRGYCEQFAGTFAVMARSLGLPARVAVGFSSGREVQPGRFQVLGRNAHAWPEVWFDGIGWVLFEPTPGRGAPGNAEVWTGQAPSQDDTPPGQGTGDLPPNNIELPTPTTVAGGAGTGASTTVPAGDVATDTAPAPGVPIAPLVILAIIGAALAWFAMAPRLANWRHRARTDVPVERVDHAWQRASGALLRAGAPAVGGATPTEWARRVERQLGLDGRAIRELARTVTTASYSPRGVDEAAATRTEVLAAELMAIAGTHRTPWGRFVDRITLR